MTETADIYSDPPNEWDGYDGSTGGADTGAAGSDDPNQSTRNAIVAVAQQYVGTVDAYSSQENDPANNKPLRVGWQYFLQFFQTAAPGHNEDDIKYWWGETGGEPNAQRHIPHWCGIFSTFCLISGGAPVGTWPGDGASLPSGFTLTQSPKPGDVGYLPQLANHFNIVTAVEGDTVHVVDPNIGGGGIHPGQYGKGDFAGFYTAFT